MVHVFDAQHAVVHAECMIELCNDISLSQQQSFRERRAALVAAVRDIYKKIPITDEQYAAIQRGIAGVVAEYEAAFGTTSGRSHLLYVRSVAQAIANFILAVRIARVPDDKPSVVVCDLDATLIIKNLAHNDKTHPDDLFRSLVHILKKYKEMNISVCILSARRGNAAHVAQLRKRVEAAGLIVAEISLSALTVAQASTMDEAEIMHFCHLEKQKTMDEWAKKYMIAASFGNEPGDLYWRGDVLLFPRPPTNGKRPPFGDGNIHMDSAFLDLPVATTVEYGKYALARDRALAYEAQVNALEKNVKVLETKAADANLRAAREGKNLLDAKAELADVQTRNVEAVAEIEALRAAGAETASRIAAERREAAANEQSFMNLRRVVARLSADIHDTRLAARKASKHVEVISRDFNSHQALAEQSPLQQNAKGAAGHAGKRKRSPAKNGEFVESDTE